MNGIILGPDLETYSKELAKNARAASFETRKLKHSVRVTFLKKLALGLKSDRSRIIAANALDLELGRNAGLSSAMLDRLSLTEKRLESMAKAVLAISILPDPLGKKLGGHKRRDGLEIRKVSVAIGSIFFIYEARPNVTVDAAALCLKSGNAVLLRGGKEARETNAALVRLIHKALKESGITEDAVQLVENPDRAIVPVLLREEANLDVCIPRGGEQLIRTVVDNSRIPVIKHYKGVCHIYLEHTADMRLAEEIIVNAKTQRPGTCNAMETLLIDRGVKVEKVRRILDRLEAKGVQLRGCPETLRTKPGIRAAEEKDWSEEYLDLILAVKVVDSVQAAVKHINRYGSHHTDAILTRSKNVEREFIENVDSSSIMVNASTRLADGGEYGLGAEVGISTDKLHARGPMGIDSLTTYQWVVTGKGHIRK